MRFTQAIPRRLAGRPDPRPRPRRWPSRSRHRRRSRRSSRRCTVELGDEQWQTDAGKRPDRRRVPRHDQAQRRRRLRQPRPGDGLEALPDDPGERRRRAAGAADPSPPSDWARHMRARAEGDRQPGRALRKRQVIDAFEAGRRRGVYVGIRSQGRQTTGLTDALAADPALTAGLAAIPTRLHDLSDELQERLINWGYVIMDAGLRAHVDPRWGTRCCLTRSAPERPCRNGRVTLCARGPRRLAPPGGRRLRTFAFDPMSTRLSGRYLVVEVAFETD